MKGNQLALLQLDIPTKRVTGEWLPQEDRTLRAFYRTHTREQIGAMLNRSEGSIRSRCWTLGLNEKVRPWTDDEIARMRSVYEGARFVRDLHLNDLAKELGRDPGNISRKARGLGLTATNRPVMPVEERKIRRPKYATKEEYRAHLSARAKRYIREHGHPHGALGMRHSAEAKARISAFHRAAWADPNSFHNTPEARQRRSDNMHRRMLAGKILTGRAVYSRCASGKRPDIGDYFFRSRWEANYARYLNLLLSREEIVSWDYECRTFLFPRNRLGTRSYTPDFKVTFNDGRYEWHEVKGWMDNASRARLESIARFYPSETVRVIGQEWYKEATKTVARLIPKWEKGEKKQMSA